MLFQIWRKSTRFVSFNIKFRAKLYIYIYIYIYIYYNSAFSKSSFTSILSFLSLNYYTYTRISATLNKIPKLLCFSATSSPNYSCVFRKYNCRVLVRVSLCVRFCVCVCVCVCTITQKEIDLGTRNWNTL